MLCPFLIFWFLVADMIRFQHNIENKQRADSTSKDKKFMFFMNSCWFAWIGKLRVLKEDLLSKYMYVSSARLPPFQRSFFCTVLQLDGSPNIGIIELQVAATISLKLIILTQKYVFALVIITLVL